jgi:hypothetical protein
MSKFFFLIILIALSGFKESAQTGRNEIIRLGYNREIFTDYYIIDKLEGIKIVMHHPHDEGAVVYFDKPWEGKFCTYSTIIKDKDIFRLYYRGMDEISGPQLTCYAESDDGIKWVKPILDLNEVKGSMQNNVVLLTEPVTHNFSPFLDSNPDITSDQKYKAFGGNSKTGLIPFVSPDGIHWRKIKDEGVIRKGAFDSQNVSFWSESEKLYVCYFRIFSDKRFRGISRSTSKDFLNWSEPVVMTYGDTPTEHLYTQQTSPYFRAPQIYLSIGARFIPDRQIMTEEQLKKLKVDPTQFKGLSDAYIMTTRGGNRYERTFMESFIRPGIGLNNWSARTNYPCLNIVQTGPEEMSLYVNQDYAQPTAHLHRYSMRLDGFTSLNASYTGGELITKQFTFSGDELELNYSTSVAGEIKIEIQDINGQPFTGFSFSESKSLVGNEIAGIASWKDNKSLKKLANKPVRLRIYMKDADLYSIRFK